MAENGLHNFNDLERAIQQQTLDDPDFRAEFMSDPKATLEKYLQQPLPVEMSVYVHENDLRNLHFSVPKPITKADLDQMELTDEQLEAVAGGEGVVVSAISAATVMVSVAVTYTANDQTRHRFGW